MVKKVLKGIFALASIAIGVYLLVSYSFPTAPALSGLAILLLGLGQWASVCPLCNKVCK